MPAMKYEGDLPSSGYDRRADGGRAKNDALAEERREGRADGGRTRRESVNGYNADGGRTKRESVNLYNAVGSPEMEEAMNEKPGFKKGGEARKKRRDGGVAAGDSDMPRMDHKARGGRAKRASGGRTSGGGGSPYSSGANISSPTTDRGANGHEGNGPA